MDLLQLGLGILTFLGFKALYLLIGFLVYKNTIAKFNKQYAHFNKTLGGKILLKALISLLLIFWLPFWMVIMARRIL